MKSIFCLLFLVTLVNCKNANNDASESKETASLDASASYQKGDLRKIKWIEGKWKGLYQGKPFYEFYQFSNDTTLEIRSFEWDGKDSSKTDISYVHFKNGFYYLGDHQNYKVISISESEINMVPHFKANNEILWKYRDSTGWDAILKGAKETLTYKMEYFDPFKK